MEVGIDGIECIHSRHSTRDIEHYMGFADRHELLVTGGSDCHGMNKGQLLIGSVTVPYEYVEQLRERFQRSQLKNIESLRWDYSIDLKLTKKNPRKLGHEIRRVVSRSPAGDMLKSWCLLGS